MQIGDEGSDVLGHEELVVWVGLHKEREEAQRDPKHFLEPLQIELIRLLLHHKYGILDQVHGELIHFKVLHYVLPYRVDDVAIRFLEFGIFVKARALEQEIREELKMILNLS